ncbi:U4/U6 x U5 tri-snRNP complex subunit Prp1 [Coemansia sp. BCRC 34301]|nr:U4/U6 x U5 tri-snRNP complex subunit Prp1 [Coemansia sp. BCRC 34301]
MYAVTKDFLGKPAPPGYVAGLGRGATGFTTRSDIGPARESSVKADEHSDQFKDAENEEGLFSGLAYGADDEEADLVWTQIDAKMAERRAGKQKKRGEELSDAPAIEEHLRGAKMQLGALTEDEWAAIPDVAQLAETAARAKRRRIAADPRKGSGAGERMVQVPDSAMAGALTGLLDPQSGGGMATDLRALGQARDAVLRMKLDSAAPGTATTTSIADTAGYLTSLSSTEPLANGGIGDVARARRLLKSVTQANPTHASGWIAAARLEEIARKPAQARAIIDEACGRCSRSEDVWLEAARLHAKGPAARSVLSRATRALPQSVRIWMAAADAEPSDAGRRRVLRRALEHVTGSVALWKAAVGAEPDPSDARILLAHAVETAPHSVDLWLALARLEPYALAQKVLNRARRAVPTSADVWVAAARLEEQCGRGEPQGLLAKAVASLRANGAAPTRDAWLALATQAGDDACPATCRAIVVATSDEGFDADDAPNDRAAAYMAEAARVQATCTEAARSLLSLAVSAAPRSPDAWRAAASLERTNGDPALVAGVLERAVASLPHDESLWLDLSRCRGGDADWGRLVLERAFAANPESESIVLAAVALEADAGQHSRAVALLERATGIGSGGSPRVWLKSAVLHQRAGSLQAALEAARRGRELFPSHPITYKLWLVESQIQQQMGDPVGARQTLGTALKDSPRLAAAELWISAAALDAQSSVPRARGVLERARVHIPHDPRLWLSAIRLESANGDAPAARVLLSRALQQCPKSGPLWAESVLLAEKQARKSASLDALKQAGTQDPHVCCVVARLFAVERKVAKAREWFKRAAAADPDCGDAWAWWLRFERENEGDSAKVESDCEKAAPRHGHVWPRIAKEPANYQKSTAEILRIVADALSQTPQLT